MRNNNTSFILITLVFSIALAGCQAGDAPRTYCKNKVPAEQWGYRKPTDPRDQDDVRLDECIENVTSLRKLKPHEYECSSKCWAKAAKLPLESASGAEWVHSAPKDSRLGAGQTCEEVECGGLLRTRD